MNKNSNTKTDTSSKMKKLKIKCKKSRGRDKLKTQKFSKSDDWQEMNIRSNSDKCFSDQECYYEATKSTQFEGLKKNKYHNNQFLKTSKHSFAENQPHHNKDKVKRNKITMITSKENINLKSNIKLEKIFIKWENLNSNKKIYNKTVKNKCSNKEKIWKTQRDSLQSNIEIIKSENINLKNERK